MGIDQDDQLVVEQVLAMLARLDLKPWFMLRHKTIFLRLQASGGCKQN